MLSKIKVFWDKVVQRLKSKEPILTVTHFKKPYQTDSLMWDSDEIFIAKRKIGLCILLSVVTLGLYAIYWKYLLVKNIRALKKDDSDCTREMIFLLFVPFYSLYWWFSRGKYIKKKFEESGFLVVGNKFVFLLFALFGMSLVSFALMQKNFNSLPSKPIERKPERFTLFTVHCSLPSVMVGLGLFLASILFVLLDIHAFSTANLPEDNKWLLFRVALFCPFVLAIATVFRLEVPNEKLKRLLPFFGLFFMPFVSITMTECLNNVFIYNMTYLGFFANYILILNFYFLIFALSGSFRLAYLIVNPVLYGFALAHSYIMDFRGTPFLPTDFLGLGTAMGVANTYNYAPTYKAVIATLIFVFIVIVAIKARTPKFNFQTKLVTRILTGFLSATLFFTYFFYNDLFVRVGISAYQWNQTRGYQNYGFAFSFFINTPFLKSPKPKNYDPKQVDTFINGKIEESEAPHKTEPEAPRPNIICIMNESLADLDVLGHLETNEDCLPFIHSLTENTIKVNLYVPVIGAGTSNTEFEFLTGHSIAFFPSGSNAYMQYVKNPLASLVSTLRSQGYSSYALHPYYASGWRRTEVYSLMGFDKFVSLEDIMDISLMRDFQQKGSDPNYLQQLMDERYPGANMLIRQYISDSYNYKILINDFEQRDKNIPYFAFNVTMQNHGGYTTSCVNFDENIYPTSVTGDYLKAKSYLSLVQKSDTAFKELIDYFSTVKEPTLICMFGDHQPSVEPQFVSEVMGVNNLTWLSIEQEQKRHITPFIIWANYDIEEQQIEMLSSNYLSSLVLKTAGVKLPDYNKYLLELSKTLPVIDTVGYIDNNGDYYKWSEVTPYSETLSEYERIQYNNVFDHDNISTATFYVDGTIPPDPEPKEEQVDPS